MSSKVHCESCLLQAEARCALYNTRERMVVLLLARDEPEDAQALADRIGVCDLDFDLLRGEARLRYQAADSACYQAASACRPLNLDAELARLSGLCVDYLRAYEAAGAAAHDAHTAMRANAATTTNICANLHI